MNIENLDKRVRNSIWFVSVVSILVLAAYVLCFWVINIAGVSVANKAGVSTKAEVWGQLGDFIGGTLNPIIAFSAFYWLATSVLLQKTELADTRKSLEASQRAQEEQAKTVLTSTKLQYINIHLEAVNAQIMAERSYINQLLQQTQIHGAQYTVITRSGTNEMLGKILPELNKEIEDLSAKRIKLMTQAEKIAPDLT